MASRRIVAFSLILGLAAVAGCGGREEGGVRWRFAIEEIEGSVQDAYARSFAEKIEERTAGEVRVDVYPYGSLGTSAQLTEQVQSGAVQLAFASPGHLGSVVPEVQIFSLHFVMSDDEDVNHRVLSESEPLHAALDAAYRERGLAFLAAIPEGWMAWTANRPLRTPADFEGLKIRTMASPLLLAAYRSYGANPTPMPYSEVYSGLQLNMIDAQVNPVFAIEEMGFYEVQDYLVLPRHLMFVATVVARPGFWDALAPERRELVQEVLSELDDESFRFQHELNARRLDTIREAGGTEILRLTDAERAAFRERSLPVRDTYREQAGERGAELLELFLSEVERFEASAAPAAPPPSP